MTLGDDAVRTRELLAELRDMAERGVYVDTMPPVLVEALQLLDARITALEATAASRDALDALPTAQCSKCKRYSWGPNAVGTLCRMAQPDGRMCPGIFRPLTTERRVDD